LYYRYGIDELILACRTRGSEVQNFNIVEENDCLALVQDYIGRIA